jgi:hypothetical protein
VVSGAGLCSCGLLRTATAAPGKDVSGVLPSKPPPVDPVVFQARFMRFADLFAMEITKAAREFAELAGTSEARIQALSWRIEYTNALWTRAAGAQPFAGLFDAIVVITALRVAHQERWLAQWGEADRPLLDALVRQEQGVWALAAEAMNEAQEREARAIVGAWLAGDPASRVVDVARLPGFADIAGSSGGGTGALVGELTALVRIDPLSSLEPAVREVELARRFAERAFYYLQRQPELLTARVELLVLRATQASEMRETLASWARVSEAAASLVKTAEGLPAAVSAEREAAVVQVAAELTAQREGLVRDLEAARGPLAELVGAVLAVLLVRWTGARWRDPGRGGAAA